MRAAVALLSAAVVGIPGASVLAPAQAHAQSNDNDYTPMNSRIRRDRQFPTEPRSTFAPRQLAAVEQQRSRTMTDAFARCLWDRSNEKGRDYIQRSDLGLVSFSQIGLDTDRVLDNYPISTCLSRVARMNNTGVSLRYSADSLRQSYIQAAYMEEYPAGPTWLVPGNSVAERALPLSANDPAVVTILDFADCLISVDAAAADYFYRTAADSEEEGAALQQVMPSLSDCLAVGQTFELSKSQLRIWFGEALWHAANNSISPAPIESDSAQPVQGNP